MIKKDIRDLSPLNYVNTSLSPSVPQRKASSNSACNSATSSSPVLRHEYPAALHTSDCRTGVISHTNHNFCLLSFSWAAAPKHLPETRIYTRNAFPRSQGPHKPDARHTVRTWKEPMPVPHKQTGGVALKGKRNAPRQLRNRHKRRYTLGTTT